MSHKLIVLRNKIKQLECENKLLKSQIKDYISSTTSFDVISSTTSFDVISSTTSFDVISSQSSDNIDLSHNSYLIHENNKLQEEIKRLKIHNKYIDFNIPDIKIVNESGSYATPTLPDNFNDINTYIDTITLQEKNHIFILLCQYNNSIIPNIYLNVVNSVTCTTYFNENYKNIKFNKHNVLDISLFYGTVNITFILEFMLMCYYIDISSFPPHVVISKEIANPTCDRLLFCGHFHRGNHPLPGDSTIISPVRNNSFYTLYRGYACPAMVYNERGYIQMKTIQDILHGCIYCMLNNIEESYIEQNKLNLEKIIKK